MLWSVYISDPDAVSRIWHGRLHPAYLYAILVPFILFEDGFDQGVVLQPAMEVVLLARLDEDPIGCVGLYEPEPGVCEIKRMWVSPDARGLGNCLVGACNSVG